VLGVFGLCGGTDGNGEISKEEFSKVQ